MSTMNAGLKAELDAIDTQIVSLIKKRMDASQKLTDAGALSAEMERATLANVAAASEKGMEDYNESIFRSMMVAQRSYANAMRGAPSGAYDEIRRALENTPSLFPQRATVACQGLEGAYSQIVCDNIFKSPAIMYFDSFEHVFRAVEAGMCQYGILPIENSTAGSVNAIYDLMLQHHFSIVRSARLRVSHCLLAKPGTKLEDIKEIYSHPQALSQSAGFLSQLSGVKLTEVSNTAVAAKLVAESGRRDVAALSSRYCGEHYNLESIRTDVQDSGSNYTRFICISKTPQIYPGADRISLMMIIPHKPGALYNVISKFNSLGINLRKLESRPIPEREFEFMFYFDIEVSVYSPEIETLFRDLESSSEQMRYLGTYSEILC